MFLLYRNQPIDLQCQSMDWFLCSGSMGLNWANLSHYLRQPLFASDIWLFLALFSRIKFRNKNHLTKYIKIA